MGKMTQEMVAEMRRLYGEGATQGALARHFGLGVAQVGRIVRGECWQAGAGRRAPTQAEADAVLARLIVVQEQVVQAPELLRKPTDAPGMTALQKRAAALGLDIDKAGKEKV